ncbi:hypothetical protein EA462_03190 [Natrarchaeobius halalkaliphilus]|uniref:DUF5518 domain-containing protein n=1 Tax=Natrarchaeobius halalkaliphilus TaxID=1679091 RepID=A0A3N6LT71_9EURY|nr:DUF5518 domain-containing protein [Natrarchaeobius halalkaliphilus]RQG93213.1 hypothetical protein EA462_03190 [Natrarchaeobius halalkaliphilus]
MVTGRTVINALIGALVGVVLSFIPFSTVVGGAAAGFLEGPDGRDGAIVGLIAGLITFVPIAGMTVLGLGVLGLGMGFAAVPFEGFAVVLFFAVVASTVVLFYTVGLALLGGYLGAYLAREYPEKRTNTRETFGMRRDERSRHDRSESRRRDRTRESTALESEAEDERHDSARWREEDDTSSE